MLIFLCADAIRSIMSRSAYVAACPGGVAGDSHYVKDSPFFKNMEGYISSALHGLTRATRKAETAAYRIELLEELVVEHDILRQVFAEILRMERRRLEVRVSKGREVGGLETQSHDGKVHDGKVLYVIM